MILDLTTFPGVWFLIFGVALALGALCVVIAILIDRVESHFATH